MVKCKCLLEQLMVLATVEPVAALEAVVWQGEGLVANVKMVQMSNSLIIIREWEYQKI